MVISLLYVCIFCYNNHLYPYFQQEPESPFIKSTCHSIHNQYSIDLKQQPIYGRGISTFSRVYRRVIILPTSRTWVDYPWPYGHDYNFITFWGPLRVLLMESGWVFGTRVGPRLLILQVNTRVITPRS